MINKRIGLFFGTFDPIHDGHIEVAKYILDNCNVPLDSIFVVSRYKNLIFRLCIYDELMNTWHFNLRLRCSHVS